MFALNASDCKIYVPTESVEAYKTAEGWSEYASDIVGYDFDVNLITFTIDGTEYQAEEGMTWGEWVDSEYNVDNKFGKDETTDSVGLGEPPLFSKYIGAERGYVSTSDIIQGGYDYILTW
jgi:hypothetical protein